MFTAGKWMPDYNPETELVPRAMTTLLLIATLSTIFMPWAGLIYFIVDPDAPIFPNSVLLSWLKRVLPMKGVPLLWCCIRGMCILFDTALLLFACYKGFGVIMNTVSCIIIYMGKQNLG